MSILHRALTRFGRSPYLLAWAALIAAISSIPNNFPATDPSELNVDKIVHFGEYVVLAALAVTAAVRGSPGASRGLLAALVIVSAWAFGAADELYQHLIPGRDPNPLDWAADAFGAVVGAVLALVVMRPEARTGPR